MTLYDETEPFVGSIGLVRRYDGDAEFWAAIEDKDRKMVRLPECRRDESGSFKDSLTGEIERCLPLSRKSDFIVSGHARSHHQAPIQWPDSQTIVWVIVQFIIVDLYGRKAEGKLAARTDLTWMSMGEIAEGQTRLRKPLCPRQRHLIDRAALLPPEFEIR
jgi:hypothetical protein